MHSIRPFKSFADSWLWRTTFFIFVFWCFQRSLQLFWFWIAVPCPILFSSHDLNLSCVYFIPSETQKKRKRSAIVIINSTHQQIFIKYTAFIRRFNVCNCKYVCGGGVSGSYLYKRKTSRQAMGLAWLRSVHRIGSDLIFWLLYLYVFVLLLACIRTRFLQGNLMRNWKLLYTVYGKNIYIYIMTIYKETGIYTIGDALKILSLLNF